MSVIKLQSAKRDKRSGSCLLWVCVLLEWKWQKLGEEVDAKHVVGYIAPPPYGINLDAQNKLILQIGPINTLAFLLGLVVNFKNRRTHSVE